MENLAHTTAVILAGGLGRRMGNIDKGLQPFAGSTLVQEVIARVVCQVDRVFLSTSNPAYARFGLALLPDAIPDQAGPLAGLLTALEQADGLVLSVPCDVPRLPFDLMARLTACMTPGVEVCCVDDGTRLHPVIALWRPAVAPKLRTYLEAGERRVQRFVESLQCAHADFRDQKPCFANVNTRDELRRLEQEP